MENVGGPRYLGAELESQGEELDEKTAEDILSKNPFKTVKKRLGSLIVGEEDNKSILFLSKLSYLRQNPTHEVLKGKSSVGKTTLASRVLKAFPQEDVKEVTRITSKSLDYLGDLNNKILYVGQLGGMNDSSSNFHIFLSENKLELRRVKGGKAKSYETTGPVSFISTTTAVNISDEMKTRTITITPDHSEQQTKKIQRHQAALDEKPWLKEEARSEVTEIREAVKWIKEYGVREVVIPFAHLIQLPSDRVRTRRDRPRLIELIKSLSMLRQKDRKIYRKNGTEYIISEPEDAIDILKHAKDIMKTTTGELEDREVKVLEELREDTRLTINSRNRKWWTAKEVSNKINKAVPTARKYLNNLAEKGYAKKQGRRGRGNRSKYRIDWEKIGGNPLENLIQVLESGKAKEKTREWKANNLKT